MFAAGQYYRHPELDTVFEATPGEGEGQWFLEDLNRSAT